MLDECRPALVPEPFETRRDDQIDRRRPVEKIQYFPFAVEFGFKVVAAAARLLDFFYFVVNRPRAFFVAVLDRAAVDDRRFHHFERALEVKMCVFAEFVGDVIDVEILKKFFERSSAPVPEILPASEVRRNLDASPMTEIVDRDDGSTAAGVVAAQLVAFDRRFRGLIFFAHIRPFEKIAIAAKMA